MLHYTHFMSIFYYLEETYHNLRQHKLRSLLTGFGVFWGIFLLVILLGAGEGFRKGVFRQFSGYAQNTVRFWCGQGPGGKPILLTAPLLRQLENNVQGVQYATPSTGGYDAAWTSYKGEDYDQAAVKGVGISYHQVSQLVLDQGRFLNSRDETLARPVCVIGPDVRQALFKEESPVGKFLNVNGHYFQVIGTLDPDAAFNREEKRAVLIPLQAFQQVFNWGTEFWHFRIALQPGFDAQKVEQKVRTYLGEQLGFDPKDKRTLYVFNLGKEAQTFNNLFQGVRIFLWIVGSCMLLSGMVGVSNMMLVQVEERTQEIGIRKVVGASAQEILIMILSESVIISLLAGGLGMIAGLGSVYVINYVLDYWDPNQQLLIAHLEFNTFAALSALLLLVVAGGVAGIMPAKRATEILPVKALSKE